jgi:hypothetical protein
VVQVEERIARAGHAVEHLPERSANPQSLTNIPLKLTCPPTPPWPPRWG